MKTLMHVSQAQRLTYVNFKSRKLTSEQLTEFRKLKERVQKDIGYSVSKGCTITVVSHPNENILKAVQMWAGLRGYKTEIANTLINGKSLALRIDDIISIAEREIEGKSCSEIMCDRGRYIVKESLSAIVTEINMNYREQVQLCKMLNTKC